MGWFSYSLILGRLHIVLCYNWCMDLTSLIQELDEARLALQIHNLRGQAISARADAALDKLQELCPHLEVDHDSEYSSGGYDYVAETRHTWHCALCKKLIKHETISHPGSYG